MLENDRVDKSGGSCECIICHYWCFHLRFRSKVCDFCRDMTQKCIGFNDAAIVIVGRNDHRIHFWCMTKSEAVNRVKNTDLSEKRGQL